jgi:hypothetical protein
VEQRVVALVREAQGSVSAAACGQAGGRVGERRASSLRRLGTTPASRAPISSKRSRSFQMSSACSRHATAAATLHERRCDMLSTLVYTLCR